MSKKLFLGFFLIFLASCSRIHVADVMQDRFPNIFPDYSDLTIPCNIAPLNFVVCEKGTSYQAEMGIGGKVYLTVTAPDSIIQIPETPWKNLLAEAQGQEMFIRILVEQEGKWVQFSDLHNKVSVTPIDPILAYRLLYPGYEFWKEMGIYQRDLTSFSETPLLENRNTGNQCMNCHSFAGKNPETMMLHVRGKNGGTLIAKDGKVCRTSPMVEGGSRSATYPYWSNDGRYIVFSSNDVHQAFHTSGVKKIEVYDQESDLFVYDVEKGVSYTDSLIFGKEAMETFPTFTPDGRQIYFCRTKPFLEESPKDSVRYGLYRIDFDPETHIFSNLECVFDAPTEGYSVSFPRISPDGRWLVYTQSRYGTFSIWHAESDLCMLDLKTGERRVLDELNSKDVDSYHSWSSIGEWLVFSSKRVDGLWACPYIAAFDPQTGMFTKPFLLPQEDPLYYDHYTRSFNIPEFVKGQVQLGNKLEQIIK